MTWAVADPQPGDLWRYDYLWQWQAMRGESEGRKTRPVTFVTAIKTPDGRVHLFILPLTTKAPGAERIAILVPPLEGRRAGLSQSPVWLLVDEYNHDILGDSYYFDPNARIGAFSPTFRAQVLQAFKDALKADATQQISRHP
jgi:hypothetical protein